MKKLVIFDLDGTLAESKSAIDAEMAQLLDRLLGLVKVAVISGGDLAAIRKRRYWPIWVATNACGIYLFSPPAGPGSTAMKTAGSRSMRRILPQWKGRRSSMRCSQTIGRAGDKPQRVWGDVIEDRGSQITFSALGQLAPLKEKTKWDPDFAKRKQMAAALELLIPEFSVHMGGATSIDITQHGIDKGYGIHKLRDVLRIEIHEMIFIGDALFPGGNDSPAKEAGALSIQVKDPHETKRVIEAITACLE